MLLIGKVVCFRQVDGLQSNEFNIGVYVKLVNGSMVFGGVVGLNLFDLDILFNYEL